MGSIEAGKTVFTKVVFPDDVPYIVSNDASALPALHYVINDTETQYDVLSAETRTARIRSGDCKPIGEGTTVFLCRKSIPSHTTGEFSVNVGGMSFEGASLVIREKGSPEPIVEQPPLTLEQEPDIPEQTNKTALQIEVEMAAEQGLTGNSPLEKAIRTYIRINERFHEIVDEEIGGHRSITYGRAAAVERSFREVTGLRGTLLLEDLPIIYFLETTGDVYRVSRYDFSVSWMIIEYMRLKYEDSDANERILKGGYQLTNDAWYHFTAV